MNENVRAAIIGLDEAEALLTVEPLYDSSSHVTLQACFIRLARMRGAGSIDVWKRSSAASFPKQVQVVRPKIDRQKIGTRKAECNAKPPASVPDALALNPEAVSRRKNYSLFPNLAGRCHRSVPLLEFPRTSRTNVIRIGAPRFG